MPRLGVEEWFRREKAIAAMTTGSVTLTVMVALGATAALGACSMFASPGSPSAAASSSSGLVQLRPAEMQKLYSTAHREDGVVSPGRPHAGAHWTRSINPDGAMTLVAGGGVFTDTGRFVIRGDTFCIAWTIIDSGKQTCYHFVKTGENAYAMYLPDGSQTSTFKVTTP